METSTQKPTREELRQRLRAQTMRGHLARMPKKQREERLETMKQKMEEEQKRLMETIRAQMNIPAEEKMTPVVVNDNDQKIEI